MSYSPTQLQCAKTQPLVSVIIPAYNAEQFIVYTLDSVLAQTYPHYEVLVVDDGSQDNTAAIVRNYAQQDGRITFLQQPNAGVAAARNLGIEKSNGEFIAPIDADDVWYPLNLEKHVNKFLCSESNVGLTYTWSIDIDKENDPTGVFRAAHIEGTVYATLLLHDFIANASSVMFRRSCLQQVGFYNSNLKAQSGQGREDWDLYLRIAEYYEFRVVPDFLTGYRKLPDSMSKDYASMAKSNEIIWQSVRQKYPKIPSMLYRLSTSSFYMHLAHQSFSTGDSKTAFFWVQEALKKDWFTPMLRTGFYQASFSYFFPKKFKMSSSFSESHQSKHKTKKASQPTMAMVKQEFDGRVIVTINSNNKQNFKTMCEMIIHFIISSVFKDPSAWITSPLKPDIN